MWSAIIEGLATGAAYGLIALGLVIIFKTSRTLNFAQGEFGTVAVYVAWAISTRTTLPYWIAVLAALATGIVLGVTTERLVVWPLRRAERVVVLVATGAIAASAIAFEQFFGQNTFHALRPITAVKGLTIAGVRIGGDQLVMIIVVICLAVLGALFFSRTMLGNAIRAAADDSIGAEAVGISIRKLSVIAWGIAGFVAALAGLLLAPLQTFSPGFLTTNGLIDGFAAMVLGGMTSMGGALIAGLVIGVIEAVSFFELGSKIPGAAPMMVFIALVLVLLVRPAGLFARQTARRA